MSEQVLSAGMRFRIVRERLHLSQQEVADKVGIARNTISNFENNADIKLSTLVDLSTTLDIPPHVWLSPDEDWLWWCQERYANALPVAWVSLEELPPGTVFVTQDGILAVKSEYRYGNEVDSQCRCILLGSGEYAHFKEGNDTLVVAVEVNL